MPKFVDLEKLQALVSYSEAQSLTPPSKGMMAHWGGILAAVTYLAEQMVIEAVHFELGHSAYPNQESDQREGRFEA